MPHGPRRATEEKEDAIAASFEISGLRGVFNGAGFGPKVFTEENLERVERLIEFAAVHGHSLLELAFSWLAVQPAVASVIAGAVSPEQVRANAAAPIWKLATGELREIDGLL